MQSSIEGYLHLSACEHFLSASTTVATVAVAFFGYNGQPLQIPACLYQATRIDNKLSWKPHVQKVKTQLSRACGILSKLKHYTNTTCTESCL